MNKGFTLIELLAVIVILAIILLIAVPQVLNVIDDSKLGSFDSDSKLVLKGVEQLAVKDNYDVSLVNEDNIDILLDIDSNDYLNVIVSEKENSLYLTKMGTGNWDGYVSYGTYGNMTTEKFPEGLIGYWPLDGDANDYSINGNDGNINGAVLTTGINDITDTAFSFDGVDDYIEVPYTEDLTPTEEISYGGWVYREDWSELLGSKRIISKTESKGYTLATDYNSATGIFEIIIYINGTFQFVSGSYLSLESGWHQVFCTFDGESLKLYIDAILQNQLSVTGTIGYAYDNSLIIGEEAYVSSIPVGNNFPGGIDEVMVFDRGLTAEEVMVLYNMYNY